MEQKKNWCFVIADDDARMLGAICAALGSEWPDADIAAAITGVEATQEVFARGGAVDLLILDVLMPEKGGLGALKDIRKRFPGIPAIAITGGFGSLSSDEAIRMITFVGASPVLRKPFTDAELISTVQSVLGSSGRCRGEAVHLK